jgi:hypothetical protein
VLPDDGQREQDGKYPKSREHSFSEMGPPESFHFLMLAEMRRLANRLLRANKEIVRSILTLVVIASWFSLSNHCAIGLAFPAQESAPQVESGSCPMHSAPVKNKRAAKPPCCKDVRAVVAKCLTANAAAVRVLGSFDYATNLVVRSEPVAREIEVLDTGPPGRFSFAESVLQRSMLAHAPPVS